MGLVRSFQISAIFPHLTVLDNVRVALQRPQRARDTSSGARCGARQLTPRAERACCSRRPRRRARTSWRAISPTAASACWRSRPRWRSIRRCCCSTSRWPAWGTRTSARVSELIRAIAKDRTVLMVEHNLTVVADLCDWVTVLQRGEILAEGDYDTVSNDAVCARPTWGPSMPERRCSRSAASTPGTARATCCTASTSTSSAARP